MRLAELHIAGMQRSKDLLHIWRLVYHIHDGDKPPEIGAMKFSTN